MMITSLVEKLIAIKSHKELAKTLYRYTHDKQVMKTTPVK